MIYQRVIVSLQVWSKIDAGTGDILMNRSMQMYRSKVAALGLVLLAAQVIHCQAQFVRVPFVRIASQRNRAEALLKEVRSNKIFKSH